jgi:hypothetical protein
MDIFDRMRYPIQIQVGFLCRDSIVAAPVSPGTVYRPARHAGMRECKDTFVLFQGTVDGAQPRCLHSVHETRNPRHRMRSPPLITHLGCEYL